MSIDFTSRGLIRSSTCNSRARSTWSSIPTGGGRYRCQVFHRRFRRLERGVAEPLLPQPRFARLGIPRNLLRRFRSSGSGSGGFAEGARGSFEQRSTCARMRSPLRSYTGSRHSKPLETGAFCFAPLADGPLSRPICQRNANAGVESPCISLHVDGLIARPAPLRP